jgi:hypothetical protein
MKNIISIAILFFMLLLAGCKKENRPGITGVQFTALSLEYIQLTPSKYFIYKDSANGDLDSVVVTKSILEMYNNTTGSINSGFFNFNCNYSQFMTLVLTKFTATISDTWFWGFANACIYQNAVQAVREVNSSGSPIHSIYGTEFTIIPSMTVESKTYNDVAESTATATVNITNPTYNKTTLYWAKKIGIIKRRIITMGGAIKTYTLLRNN